MKLNVGDWAVCVEAEEASGLRVGDIMQIRSATEDSANGVFYRFFGRGFGNYERRFRAATPEETANAECCDAPDAFDPNDEMLTEDENEEKAKEFERILRERHPEYEIDPSECYIDGQVSEDAEDLANAIEKTTSGAQHPQAMWRK